MQKDTIIVTVRVNKEIHGPMKTITFDLNLRDLIYAKLKRRGYFKKLIEKIDICFEYEGAEILKRERSEREHYKYLKSKYEGTKK